MHKFKNYYREEWESLSQWCGSNEKVGHSSNSEHQRVFVEQVAATARRLFTYMEVNNDEAPTHRLDMIVSILSFSRLES